VFFFVIVVGNSPLLLRNRAVHAFHILHGQPVFMTSSIGYRSASLRNRFSRQIPRIVGTGGEFFFPGNPSLRRALLSSELVPCNPLEFFFHVGKLLCPYKTPSPKQYHFLRRRFFGGCSYYGPPPSPKNGRPFHQPGQGEFLQNKGPDVVFPAFLLILLLDTGEVPPFQIINAFNPFFPRFFGYAGTNS